MKSSCSCTRFISTRQKKLGDGAAQQERARTSLPRCDPARWQSAQKYGTWTHEHVVSDRTMQSTGSLSGAWTAWLERLPDLRPSPAAPKSSTPALETILQKPLNGGILMWLAEAMASSVVSAPKASARDRRLPTAEDGVISGRG
jgi:hypothetical protein